MGLEKCFTWVLSRMERENIAIPLSPFPFIPLHPNTMQTLLNWLMRGICSRSYSWWCKRLPVLLFLLHLSYWKWIDVCGMCSAKGNGEIQGKKLKRIMLMETVKCWRYIINGKTRKWSDSLIIPPPVHLWCCVFYSLCLRVFLKKSVLWLQIIVAWTLLGNSSLNDVGEDPLLMYSLWSGC